MREIRTPLTDIHMLQAGELVEISGVLYTARDAAHQRLMHLLERGERLPFPVAGNIVYYVGPCPPGPGQVLGSAGPTTASRMDSMTVPLLQAGLKGMIGKGERSDEVVAALQEWGAVYFAAIGGAGALLSTKIRQVEQVAFAELGPEAVYQLQVDKFPVVVAVDSRGRSIYRREGGASWHG